MTRTIKRLTWVNTIAVVLALLAATPSAAIALHVGGLGR
jgi:hypothetical protein